MCKASNIKFPSEIIQCFDEALQRHLFWNLVSHLTVADLFKIIKTESFPRWMTLGPGIKTSLVFLKGSFHAYKPGSCIHQTQRTLFFFMLSARKLQKGRCPGHQCRWSFSLLYNMVLKAAGFQVNKYSGTIKYEWIQIIHPCYLKKDFLSGVWLFGKNNCFVHRSVICLLGFS